MNPSTIIGLKRMLMAEPGKFYPVDNIGDFNMAGIKHDEEKLRMDLIPVSALEAMAKILTFGAKKYGDRNWEAGLAFSRVYGALLRHLTAWWAGEDTDKESGESHLAHVLCCAAFLNEYRTTKTSFDDRPHKPTAASSASTERS